MSLFFLGTQTRRNCDQLKNIKASCRACKLVCAFKSKGKTCYTRLGVGDLHCFGCVGKSLIQTRNSRGLRALDEGWRCMHRHLEIYCNVSLTYYNMHEALKQHNVLTIITGSSSMIHWCTCRNVIPRCIIAKQQWDYSHHIEHLQGGG